MSSEESEDLEMDEVGLEMTDEQLRTLMDLEQSLQNDPADYDAHLRYVSLLRSCGLREKLREARKEFQEAYPLTETLWLEWIEDESTALETMEDVERLEALLKKSHGDYLSVSLWKEHIEVSKARFEQRKAKGEEEGAAATAVREVIDEALEDCGLHLVDGAALWNMSLNFEMDGIHEDYRDDARIERLFAKFFACPFPPEVLCAARVRYVAWLRDIYGGESVGEGETMSIGDEQDGAINEDGGIPRAVEKMMERAARGYELRRGHEEALIAARAVDPRGMALMSVYASYIELEVQSGPGCEGRVRTIFERAIVEFPTSDYLWKSYIGWTDAHAPLGNIEFPGKRSGSRSALVRRALRNCPWSGDIWARHLEASDPLSDDSDEFSRCRQFLRSNASEYQKAVVARVRRSNDAASSEELLRECLRLLKEQNIVDPEHRSAWLLSSMIAKGLVSKIPNGQKAGKGDTGTECHLAMEGSDGVDAGALIWEALVAGATLDAQYSGTWISYYEYLVRFGGTVAARRGVLQRAMDSPMAATDKSYLAAMWLSFEEREGSEEDLDKARRACLDVLRQSEAAQRGITLDLELIIRLLAEEGKKQKRQQNDPNYKRGSEKSQVLKEKKGKGGKGQKNAKRERESQAGRKRKASGTDMPDVASNPDKPSNNKPPNMPKEALSKPDWVTVFVKYIEASVTEEELAAEFSSCGSDLEVSLGRDPKTGRSKGFAYIKCSQETSDKLCALNGKEHRGKRLFIAPSDPPEKKSKGHGRAGIKNAKDGQKGPSPKDRQRSKIGDGFATMLVPRGAKAPAKAATKAAAVSAPGTSAAPAECAPKSNDEFRSMFSLKK